MTQKCLVCVMLLIEQFLKNTRMYSNQQEYNELMKLVAWFFTAERINRMLAATEYGVPALAGVVEELEKEYGDNPYFPLHHNGAGANAKYRRNIGWIVKFVMAQLGYVPKAQGRIGSKSKYFSTSAIYVRDNNLKPKIKLIMELDAN